IAREVGFEDELYFSRVFRKATGMSPTEYREFETAIRGGSNLSMPSAGPSIPPPPLAGQNAPTPASEPRKPGACPRATLSGGETMDAILKLFRVAASADRVGLTVTRVGLVVVLVWIGGLKVYQYEADGIVPFVANS